MVGNIFTLDVYLDSFYMVNVMIKELNLANRVNLKQKTCWLSIFLKAHKKTLQKELPNHFAQVLVWYKLFL